MSLGQGALHRFVSVLAVSILASITFAITVLPKQIPVILDTDIGDDIDDTWALGLLLKSPELDLKLAVTESGRKEYRARLLAKYLQENGRTDVGLGMGAITSPEGDGRQGDWVNDYRLEQYPGPVYTDGVQTMIDTIMRSKEPITLICIGPVTNVSAALSREPRIARRVNIVCMAGSVRLGYGGSKTISPEWNVQADPASAQHVFEAPWKSMTITPLDTCGLVTLDGEPYQRMLNSSDRIAKGIVENYRIWSRNSEYDSEHKSSTLYDTVAVYLAMHRELCRMERLKIRVTDNGFTVIDPRARSMSVATSWKSLDAYREFLVNRLTGSQSLQGK